MAEAYENRDLEGLKAKMEQLPVYTYKMANMFFNNARRPLAVAFEEQFLWNDRLEDFSDEADFGQFVEMNTLVAEFIGDVDMGRGDYGEELHVLERNTLKRLRGYYDKFHSEGRTGLEKIAERYIAKWIVHIESDSGFTRRYMWFQVGLQWEQVEGGKWTLQQLIDFVRPYGLSFSDAGYTPKWLDEFQDNEEFRRKKGIPFPHANGRIEK